MQNYFIVKLNCAHCKKTNQRKLKNINYNLAQQHMLATRDLNQRGWAGNTEGRMLCPKCTEMVVNQRESAIQQQKLALASAGINELAANLLSFNLPTTAVSQ